LKTFAVGSSVPQVKRRKIDHGTELEAKYADEHQELSRLDDTDQVDEPEEGPETATIGLLEEDVEPEDPTDPFELHFADPEENVLAQRLEALNKKQWATRKAILPKVGRAYISGPLLPESPAISEPSRLKLKQKLAGIVTKLRPSFDPLEASIAAPMFDYRDVFYCERSVGNAENLRRLVCLHAVNHIFK
jgi:U3 small nucleolar RNA-associated protein 25